MEVWRLALVLAVDLALGGLVLWRILGPLRPSRRATAIFAAGVVTLTAGLAVAVVLVLPDT